MSEGVSSIAGMGGESERALSAILFISASTNALDVYSALNSSPWTAESFGGDPEKAAACKEYVYHSMGVTGFYAVVGSLIARNVWPVVGAVLANGYMYWLYDRALKRAVERDSSGWDG